MLHPFCRVVTTMVAIVHGRLSFSVLGLRARLEVSAEPLKAVSNGPAKTCQEKNHAFAAANEAMMAQPVASAWVRLSTIPFAIGDAFEIALRTRILGGHVFLREEFAGVQGGGEAVFDA
jgi:hypothetical protein